MCCLRRHLPATPAASPTAALPCPCHPPLAQRSLEELNGQLAYKGEAEVPMDRFRPNLVVRPTLLTLHVC